MSTRRSTSWASVVATGIIGDPLLLPACARPPSPKSSCIGSLTQGKTTAATFPTLTKSPKPIEALTAAEPVAESTSQSQISSTSPLKNSAPVSPAADSYSSSNYQSPSQDFGRPFRSVWPRQGTRFQENQQHHWNNSQTANYRARRHHENMRSRTNYAYGYSYRRQHRGSKSMIQMPYSYKNPRYTRNQTTFYYQMPENCENGSGSQTSQYEQDYCGWNYGSSGRFMSNEEFAMMGLQTYGPNMNYSDIYQNRRACVSPRARVRCQVPFSSSECDLIEWQSIGESRRVWEPLDRTQLHLDPSNDFRMPPGFENIRSGKASLSTRTRQLMGEQVREASHTDYPTPTPMSMPEVPLREHLCFIVNYDTHLTKSQAQLRVTNGATGDGYYVSQVPKLVPISMFLCPPGAASVADPAPSSPPPEAPPAPAPNHRVFRPSVSYWDLLRYNQEMGQNSQVDFSQDFGTVYFNGYMNGYGDEANQESMYSQMPFDYDYQETLPDIFPTESFNLTAPNDDYALANEANEAFGDRSD